MEDFTYKNTKYRSAVVVNGMSMAGPLPGNGTVE